VIRHCTIHGNWAEAEGTTGGGGGIFVGSDSANGSEPEIRECRVYDNDSGGYGGGIYSFSSAPKILNCTPDRTVDWGIWYNRAEDFGGGIAIFGASEARIINCTIDGNEAAYGGGMELDGNDPDDTKPLIVNCRITNNTCEFDGGGIDSIKSKTTVLNTTIADNNASSSSGRGGGYFESTHPGAGSSIVNSILWDNTADGASQQVSVEQFGGGEEKFLRIAYSDVEGGTSEIEDPDEMVDYQSSNVNVPPDLEDETYRPCSGSAIRDIGTNLELVIDELDVDDDGDDRELTPDLAGLFRVVAGTEDPEGCVVDMGAYEYACPDFEDDGCVDFYDILAILDNWDAVECVHDLDQDGTVGNSDLVRVLSAWGPCTCVDEEACGTLGEDLECMGLTAQDWSEFVSNADDEDYRCWMDHYWYIHCQCRGTCFDTVPTGCGADPFGGHP
jgi:hypothetical protein